MNAFLPAEYVPPVSLKEPRGMQGDAIEKALDFWRNREAQYGPSGTLKFSHYINGHRERVPAEYGHSAANDKAAAAAANKKKSRKRTKKSRPAIPELAETLSGLIRMPNNIPEDAVHIQDTSGMHSTTAVQPVTALVGSMTLPAPAHLAAEPGLTNPAPPSSTAAFAGPTSPESNDGCENEDTPSPPVIIIDGILVPDGYTLVDEEMGQRLRDVGIAIPPPANGPDEGLPRYIVSTSAVESLDQDIFAPSELDHNEAEEHALVVPLRRNNRRKKSAHTEESTRRKSRRVDLAVEEAMTFTGNRSLRSDRAAGEKGMTTRASGRMTRQSGGRT